MIKISNHTIDYSNTNKKETLHDFVDEYRRVASIYLDYLWTNEFTWSDKKGNSYTLDIKNNKLDHPKMMSNKNLEQQLSLSSDLSARAKSCCLTQVLGIIGASIEKQRKRLYTLKKKKEEGKTNYQLKSLIKKIKQNIPQKPNIGNINPELNSICTNWKDTQDGLFLGYLQLKSIGKKYGKIRIPITNHRHVKKLSAKGQRMTSFLISKNNINVRWKIEKPKAKSTGNVIGADQGMKTVLTCSNRNVTSMACNHGHSLESILKKLSNKRKGSKSFKRAQQHRKNFVNWSINQLNFNEVKEIRLEKIWNIGYKSRTNRLMSHWTNTLIRDKIESKCEEQGIRLIHQSSTYRSQRCSNCGVVRRANRKGKIYKCKHCSHEIDADLNAALNHEIDLPEIPYTLRKSKANLGNGFYWNSDGFFDYSTGRSLQSLPPVELNDSHS